MVACGIGVEVLRKEVTSSGEALEKGHVSAKPCRDPHPSMFQRVSWCNLPDPSYAYARRNVDRSIWMCAGCKRVSSSDGQGNRKLIAKSEESSRIVK